MKSEAILTAVGRILKAERERTNEQIAALEAKIAAQDATRGAARTILSANVEALQRALEPVVEKRAAVLEGAAPDWAEEALR